MSRVLSIAVMYAPSLTVRAGDLDRTLDDYLRPAAEKREFTGVVLVAQNGKPIVRRAYGYADWLRPHEHVYLIVVANRETDADYPYIKGCGDRVQQWLDAQAEPKTSP